MRRLLFVPKAISGGSYPATPLSRRMLSGGHMKEEGAKGFPTFGGVLLGLGVGGFFDGIVFHQLLQWHHMLSSAGYPPDTVANLLVNTLWDGVFHAGTYVAIAVGLAIFWRHARREHVPWSGKMLAGTLLIGWGLFNVVEGIVNHHVLGLHHVNETAPPAQWIVWDLSFLAWGAVMALAGAYLLQRGKAETSASAARFSGV
jgi:uncharacterized membrane protein